MSLTPGPLRHRIGAHELLEGAVFFKNGVEVADQQDAFALVAPAFGKQVPGPVHAVGHVDPAGGEAEAVEFLPENGAYLPYAFVVARAAVDVDDLFEQVEGAARLFAHVPDHLPLGRREPLGPQRGTGAKSSTRARRRKDRDGSRAEERGHTGAQVVGALKIITITNYQLTNAAGDWNYDLTRRATGSYTEIHAKAQKSAKEAKKKGA
jgi:hypothetical protein